MGLLAQAFEGALAAGGTTAGNLMSQDEMAKAQAIREQNLAQFKQGLEDQSFANRQNATYSPYTVNGGPATFGDVKATVAANNQADAIRAAADQRGTDALNQAESAGPPTQDAVDSAKAQGNLSADDQAKLDALKGKTGTVAYTPEQMMQNKLDMQQTLSQNKLDAWKEIAQTKADAAMAVANINAQRAKDLFDMKVSLGMASNTAEYKKMEAETKAAEAQRKAAVDAVKLLNEGNMSDPNIVNNYNHLMSLAGTPESSITVPPPVPPKEKSKGLIDSVKDFFSSDSHAAAPPAGFKPNGKTIGGKPAYVSADGKQVWTP